MIVLIVVVKKVASEENYKMFEKNIMRDIFGKLQEKKRKENTEMVIPCTY